MFSPDHPELVFVQAAGYSRGRPDGPPLWIVVHDMEATETSTRAESTAAYFANPGDGRSVSSHYAVDSDSVVQCVLLRDVAWTVGNRPGNNRGINWELSGFARQSRADWLDPFGLGMFAQMAPIVRADALKYGIPLERRTVPELKAMRPGITSHNDLRLAFGDTTHTDPGPNFPWDVFMTIMTEEDMTPDQAAKLQAIYSAIFKGGSSCGFDAAPNNGLPASSSIIQKADALLERSATGVDPDALAAAVKEAVNAALADPEILAGISKAVNDDHAVRMASKVI